jgi:glucosamine--fructose-6-phosphate aminotransferase (isomerizing)
MPAAPRSGHPYHMHEAMLAQPDALRALTSGQDDRIAEAAARLREAPHVWLAGIGSSWHAALVGEAMLARTGRLGRRVRAIQTPDLVDDPFDNGGGAVVAISHRGNPDLETALARAAAAGGATVAVTGRGVTTRAALALRTVALEASGCHTVSYTTALAMLAALAAAVGRDPAAARELEALPDVVAGLLGREAWDERASRLGGRRHYWFVGAGPNVATAYEIALKLTEAAWIPATGLSAEQFLHGPWAALEPADVVVLIALPGPASARCGAVARVAVEVGATVVALVASEDREVAPLATETIVLPAVPALLSPIVAVVPLQLLTYHLAVKAGANPDTLRAEQPAHGRAGAALAR